MHWVHRISVSNAACSSVDSSGAVVVVAGLEVVVVVVDDVVSLASDPSSSLHAASRPARASVATVTVRAGLVVVA
jgi:hypothetical protein